MSRTYLPSKEAELGQWTTHFVEQVAELLASIGISPAQSTNLNALNTTWIEALSAATAEATRSKPTIIAKNTAKAAILTAVRQAVGIIQKYPGTTDESRGLLGITIPDVGPSPRPIPQTAPLVIVKSVYQKTVTVSLRDVENPTRRAKPEFVAGAQLYTFVGANPPTGDQQWRFEGGITRPEVEIDFPDSTANFAKVWFLAVWYNNRGETGPKSNVVFTSLGSTDGSGLAQAA